MSDKKNVISIVNKILAILESDGSDENCGAKKSMNIIQQRRK